uniref:Rx_N domain-containing protein n=1 Tax=Angiostrongylus cantonensis TaxID=6313 RepID=A0A0K0DAT1_ANGCA
MKRWLDEVDTSLNKDKLGFLDELKDVVLSVEHDLHELLSIFTTTWEEELIEAKKLLLSSSLLQFNEDDPLCENTGKTSSSGGGGTSSHYRNELVFKRQAATSISFCSLTTVVHKGSRFGVKIQLELVDSPSSVPISILNVAQA